MDEFEFYNPVKIIFGRGKVDETGNHIAATARSVLLCTGSGSAKRNGVFDRITAGLVKNNIVFHELSGIQSNPLLSRVRKGISIVKEYDIEAVLAVGGGSVMDTAKAVAAGSLIEHGDIWDCFTGEMEIEEALPVLTVPTIAASGSEMNGFMVITHDEKVLKLAAGSPYVYPAISILDPELTYTVPADYTAYGGLDAVCHLLEPFFNGSWPYTPVQDGITYGLINALMKATERCITHADEYDARAAMMWGATLALNGLTKAGVGDHFFPVHLIEHSVSALFNVPHGAGLAALLPGWMEWFAANGHEERVAALGQNIFSIDQAIPAEEAAGQTVMLFSRWLDAVGCPHDLEGISVSMNNHQAIAGNAMVQAAIWGIEKAYDMNTIADILASCQNRSI